MSRLLAAALALFLPACAGPKNAPPPPMGDLSGAWLLETDHRPIRFVSADGDTTTLTVESEPLVLRPGAAVSDTSIALDIAGIRVVGAIEATKGLHRSTGAELVTTGASTGRLTFFARFLRFEGRWSDDAFAGEFRVDPEQAGKDVVVLDSPQTWRLRPMARSAP